MIASEHMNAEIYKTWYARSLQNPEQFWSELAQQFVTWIKPWNTVLSGSFATFDVRWFVGAKLNVAYNCLDRHLASRSKQAAIIWQGDNPQESQIITYQDLYERVCRFANVLKQYDVKKGDRVCIYLPMIPEAAIAMLACARIGAIHSVVFAGFSAESLRMRILDADCKLMITANESIRGHKIIPLKEYVDVALRECQQVKNVIVVKRTENNVAWQANRDVWYHDAMKNAQEECVVEAMDTNDPLFILYTSGSTGKPKGILHSSGAYLVYAAVTHQYIFDYQPGEIYWCTADVGWITGHSYVLYGPLANGATTLMFEGVPNYPTPARFWEIIDKYKVNIFYTAPTAIRALRREGDNWVTSCQRDSLRILGTVGEPINPDAWQWFYDVVGNKQCPVVDTWWQTETGGIMISPIPGAISLKPGSATLPFFGIAPVIVDDQGHIINDEKMGQLVITKPWPGMMLTVYGDHERFVDNYFRSVPGNYLSGDQAYKDKDGNYWIQGRSDDVIKVSGHRIGTQEVESALIHAPSVAEAAVVGINDAIKGQSIYAFVTLKAGATPSDHLKQELVQTVREVIGPIATPDHIQWAEGLPKTRSGKIMRRILRKIANNETGDLGDLSTLADPGVVEELIKKRKG